MRSSGRGIGANVKVKGSKRGTWGQLVGGIVEVQVAEFFPGDAMIRARKKRIESPHH